MFPLFLVKLFSHVWFVYLFQVVSFPGFCILFFISCFLLFFVGFGPFLRRLHSLQCLFFDSATLSIFGIRWPHSIGCQFVLLLVLSNFYHVSLNVLNCIATLEMHKFKMELFKQKMAAYDAWVTA